MSVLQTLKNDGWRIDEVKFRDYMGDTFDEKVGKEELKKVLSDV
jgi:hypothetical protein